MDAIIMKAGLLCMNGGILHGQENLSLHGHEAKHHPQPSAQNPSYSTRLPPLLNQKTSMRIQFIHTSH